MRVAIEDGVDCQTAANRLPFQEFIPQQGRGNRRQRRGAFLGCLQRTTAGRSTMACQRLHGLLAAVPRVYLDTRRTASSRLRRAASVLSYGIGVRQRLQRTDAALGTLARLRWQYLQWHGDCHQAQERFHTTSPKSLHRWLLVKLHEDTASLVRVSTTCGNHIKPKQKSRRIPRQKLEGDGF